MGIQYTTAKDAALAAKRDAFLTCHRLKDYRLSGRHLMRMAIDAAGTRESDAVRRIRGRFTHGYGCYLQWHGPTWDHLEMLGRDGSPLVLVSHPYSIDDEGRADMELFRSAGLVVHVGEDSESWYGFQSHHVRVEHPSLIPGRTRAGAAFTTRLNDAAPELLFEVQEHYHQLVTMLGTGLLPCVASRPQAGTCFHCEMARDVARIGALLARVYGTKQP